MILMPAIDIRGGKCVRLIQGDYGRETVYHDSPADMAKQFEEEGAGFIHVVDLDAAKTGDSLNMRAIKDIVRAVQVPVQVGGGIRSMEQVKRFSESGVSRMIIGTAAVEDPEFLRKAAAAYQEKIAVSIDAKDGFVATNGWTRTSGVKAVDLLRELSEIGIKTAVYTDIAKDGMLNGPNFKELQEMNKVSSVDIIASGGVTTAEDVKQLSDMGLYGAIIGKALYEGKANLRQLLEEMNDGK